MARRQGRSRASQLGLSLFDSAPVAEPSNRREPGYARQRNAWPAHGLCKRQPDLPSLRIIAADFQSRQAVKTRRSHAYDNNRSAGHKNRSADGVFGRVKLRAPEIIADEGNRRRPGAVIIPRDEPAPLSL